MAYWLRNGDCVDDVELTPDRDCLAEMRVKDSKSVHGLLIGNDNLR